MAYGLGFAVAVAATWIGPKFALARLVLVSDDK
jgi:hypothetical protein